MFADFLFAIWPYQIFASVIFRGTMAFLTAYALIALGMPSLIRLFRREGITSDYLSPDSPASDQLTPDQLAPDHLAPDQLPLPQAPESSTPASTSQNEQLQDDRRQDDQQGARQPYRGAKPIMGGGLLVVAVLLSSLVWVRINQFTMAALLIMLGFALVGGIDDGLKIRHKRRVQAGRITAKHYSDKADGLGGFWRLGTEFLLASVVVVVLYRVLDIDGHLVIPFIPLDWWYPYLPREFFIPLMVLIIVAGANAVNLTDGMDSLATVPLISCTLFVAAAAYVGSEPELAQRLRLPVLPAAVKEVLVFCAALVSAGLAFLRFNAPPAMITMGDLGALSLGSTVSVLFIFAKVELFLPLVGGVFVLTTLSTIVQRLFFKYMLRRYGRKQAEKRRFFYRAPYHHHLQRLWQYSKKPSAIESVWVELLRRLGLRPIADEDKLLRQEDVNSRIIWRMHMVSIWLLVLTLMAYFKVR